MVTNSSIIPRPPPLPPVYTPKSVCEAVQRRVRIYSLENLINLKLTTCEWIRKAYYVSVDKETMRELAQRIGAVVANAPSLFRADNGAIEEVALNQQMFFYSFYCNHIIRQILLTETIRLVDQYLSEPSLRCVSSMIRDCEYLVENELHANPPKPFQMPDATERQCRELWSRLELKRDEIAKCAAEISDYCSTSISKL
jgi:hypothetical protein